MRFIQEDKKKIILEDKDVIEIETLSSNRSKMIVTCLSGILHIEENIETINERTEEENAIKTMQKYLKNRKYFQKK